MPAYVSLLESKHYSSVDPMILFIAIQDKTIDKTLGFSQNSSSTCFNINIVDDQVALETPEVFQLELSQTENPLLQVTVNSTTLLIVDNDGKYMNL